MFLSRGGAIFGSVIFVKFIFILQKSGGEGGAKASPQPLPLRGPAREGILVPNKALVIVF